MSTAIDSTRVGTTREIDNDYILLHTFEGDIFFPLSLPLFHAYVFFFISLPVGTPRTPNEDTSEKRGQTEMARGRVCIKYAFYNRQ